MFKKIVILMMIWVIGIGCETGVLNLTIRFDDIQGLKSNDGVIFEKNRIGKVDEVSYTKEGTYRVQLKIDKTFKDSATEHARFFIVSDPQNKGHKAVEMIQIRKGGEPLQNNAVIEGSRQSSAIFERFEKDVEKGIEDFKILLDEFAEELKKVPDSEAFKSLEEALSDLYDEMERSGKEVREKIQKEILPRLEQELENLKKRLQKKGKEDELKPLEIKMEEIKRI